MFSADGISQLFIAKCSSSWVPSPGGVNPKILLIGICCFSA